MEDALIWAPKARTWQPPTEIPADTPIGLYEALRADVTAEALRANQARIASSLRACAARARAPWGLGDGEWPDGLPTVADGIAHLREIGWFACRFEVRGTPDGRFTASLLRRDRPILGNPVQLMPVSTGAEDAAYPHKYLRRENLTRWRQAALDAGADDALFVVGGWVREATAGFVGRVEEGSISVPPLAADVLPSTTRQMLARWLDPLGIAVLERDFSLPTMPDAGVGWIYGNAIAGILPAVIASRSDTPRAHDARLPPWLDLAAVNATIFTGPPAGPAESDGG